MAHGEHGHAGKSSRDFLDAGRVLQQAGITGGEVVLDAGCGGGHFSLAASSLVGPGGMVWAVDSDQPSLEILTREMFTKGVKNVRPLLADLTRPLPLKDASVDHGLMVNVLHGFAWDGRFDTVLGELFRIIRPGGHLVVVEFKKTEMPIGPPLEVRLSPGEVEKLASPVGFAPEREFDAGQYSYAVVLKKRE